MNKVSYSPLGCLFLGSIICASVEYYHVLRSSDALVSSINFTWELDRNADSQQELWEETRKFILTNCPGDSNAHNACSCLQTNYIAWLTLPRTMHSMVASQWNKRKHLGSQNTCYKEIICQYLKKNKLQEEFQENFSKRSEWHIISKSERHR